MAGEMAGWCGPDRYVDSQGRVHVAVVDEGKAVIEGCLRCSLPYEGCGGANCTPECREDGKDVHFELGAIGAKVVYGCRAVPIAVCEVQEAVRGPQGTEGGGE